MPLVVRSLPPGSERVRCEGKLGFPPRYEKGTSKWNPYQCKKRAQWIVGKLALCSICMGRAREKDQNEKA